MGIVQKTDEGGGVQYTQGIDKWEKWNYTAIAAAAIFFSNLIVFAFE